MQTHPRARIPLSLTLLRAFLGPVILACAFVAPNRVVFGLCLSLAFLSDVFDGVLARRLDVVTPSLRLLDSLVDTVFYACATFSAFKLYPAALSAHAIAIMALIGLELCRYILDWRKFRGVASYHMWSSKLWGVLLFVAFFSLLVFGRAGVALSAAIYAGILADIEGIVISWVLPELRTDVASLFHAMRTDYRASTAACSVPPCRGFPL